ncbi:MAG: copper resistance CopC/CopD family protein [Acidimicrobiia bacterium]
MASKTERGAVWSVRRTTELAITAAIVVLILVTAVPAFGHAELLSASVTDGQVFSDDVERIELEFTDVVTPVSIRLIEGRSSLAGNIVQPTTSSIVVEPAQPLGTGQYALLWKVRTLDDHVVEGTISFRVEIPGEATDGLPTTTVVAAQASTPEPTLATTTTLPLVSTRLPAAAFVVQAQPEPDPAPGDWIRRIGRWAGMTGALLAVGALAFAGTALIGTRDEVARSVRWVRRGGVLVLVGAAMEVVGASAMQADSLLGALAPAALLDVLTASFGVAVLLRVVGGVALLQDPRMATVAEVPQTTPQADPHTGAVATMTPVEPGYRLALRHEWVAIAGALMVAASFAFDGHSVTTDPAILARSSSFVHVLAGGVWFGGLVAMLGVIRSRRAEGRSWEIALLSLRFSRVATIALALVALAGTLLALMILDSPADLLDTSWGRLLMVKVGLVVVAAGIGAYNHFRVVPSLTNGGIGTHTLEQTVRTEAIILSVVVAISAVLVGLVA